MPVALVPELQLLSVMGVPEIDASASYAMSLPNKDNQFNSTASLSVAKLGTADFAVKGEFPYEEFLEIVNKTKSVDDPATEDAIENFVEKNIKFSHIEAGYADEGLLPRLGILGQKFMGLTPEQCVDMAKKYVKESPRRRRRDGKHGEAHGVHRQARRYPPHLQHGKADSR